MPHDRAVRALTRLGGCATWRQLRVEVPARRLRRAAAAGAIVRSGRGRYLLPGLDTHRAVAHRTAGTVSHLSAAIEHGWAVKTPPDRPWVTYPRNRHLRPEGRAEGHPRWGSLTAAEVEAGVTDPVRTVLDCARVLPFDEALAVADSALRAGDVTRDALVATAAHLRGPGAPAARRVASLADGRAANPFESVLRAIALEVPELHLEPQHRVWDRGLWATVDLGDPELRLALEAEGFGAVPPPPRGT